MVKTKLAKQKMNSNTLVKKCDGCGDNRPVYLKTKVKVNHAEDSIMCSKQCVKKVFGKSQ